MKDLIDSNDSKGKVAHYDETYQMICILCGYVKQHMITEPNKSLVPTSGRFFQNSYRPLEP